MFLAVGPGGTQSLMMTSSNGLTWTVRAPPDASNWNSVTWSESLQLFITVSNENIVDHIATSPDGINWTLRNGAVNIGIQHVTWAESIGMFVAVGDNFIETSTDGITWTQRSSPLNIQWSFVMWSPTLSLFIAATKFSPYTYTTSPDGITWANRTAATEYIYGVDWSPQLSLFVMVGGGVGCVSTSPDGINWTVRTAVNPSVTYSGVRWSSELLGFIVISSSDLIMTSTDGITWVQSTFPDVTSFTMNAIEWSKEEGIAVIVSGSVNVLFCP